MKTTVRATVVIPDCYVTIQRVYDLGTYFKLERETKIGESAADFIDKLKAQGGKLLESCEYIDEDDHTKKIRALFEYIKT